MFNLIFMENKLVNKVERSGIITVDILDLKPTEKAVFLDLKQFLFMEMIVKEKEFKEALEQFSWEQFRDKPVAIGCSVDTIIPSWAYMMLVKYLEGVTSALDYCSIEDLEIQLWKTNILKENFSHLKNEKVVVRARADIAPSLYIIMTEKLKPLVGTLLYGEAGMPKVIHKNK